VAEFDRQWMVDTTRSTEPDFNIRPDQPVRTIVNRALRDADGNPAPRLPASCG